MDAVVTAVSRSPTHLLAKPNQDSIRLSAGLGVEGDAHRQTPLTGEARPEPA